MAVTPAQLLAAPGSLTTGLERIRFPSPELTLTAPVTCQRCSLKTWKFSLCTNNPPF